MATSLTTTSRIDLALLVLRVIIGGIFIAHGAQKLFVFGLDGAAGAFAQMGAPMPAVTSAISAFIEFFGGIALVLGLLARWAGLGLALDMAGAMMIVHLKNGFFLPMGIEFVLALFAGAVTIAIAGAGAYSAERALASRRRTA